MVISGCTYESENPKVQGARQIALLEEEGKNNVLNEGKKLLEKDADFVIDISVARICVFDRKESVTVKNNEIPIIIEKKFKGSFDNEATYYASHLPVGTKVNFKLEDSTDYLYTKELSELYKVYRCDYYNEER